MNIGTFLLMPSPAGASSEEVLDRSAGQVGISHFNCDFCFGDLDQKRVLRSMERLAGEVIPAAQ